MGNDRLSPLVYARNVHRAWPRRWVDFADEPFPVLPYESAFPIWQDF